MTEKEFYEDVLKRIKRATEGWDDGVIQGIHAMIDDVLTDNYNPQSFYFCGNKGDELVKR